jgi:ATP-binding cassette subfamily A (ABC1) protein 3
VLFSGKNTGVRLFVQQFAAMLQKRIRCSLRSWLLNSSQLLVPLIFTIVAMIVIKTIPGPEDSPSLSLGLARLPESFAVYSSGFNESGLGIASAYASALQRLYPSTHLMYVNNASAEYASDPDIIKYLTEEGRRSMATYNTRYIIALDISKDASSDSLKASVLFNNQGYHAQAISLSAFTNALLCHLFDSSNATVTVVNHPMPRTVNDTVSDELTRDIQGFSIAVNLLFGMSFLAASFALFLVRERAVKAKHCQFASGVDAMTFWWATFVWDIVNFIVPCIAIIITYRAFDIVPYWADGRFADVFLLMLLYGWGMLPFMYLLSFIFSVPATSLVWLTMFNILSGNPLTSS